MRRADRRQRNPPFARDKEAGTLASSVPRTLAGAMQLCSHTMQSCVGLTCQVVGCLTSFWLWYFSICFTPRVLHSRCTLILTSLTFRHGIKFSTTSFEIYRPGIFSCSPFSAQFSLHPLSAPSFLVLPPLPTP